MLALVHFLKFYRHFLYENQFVVRTDHALLKWLMDFKNPKDQIALLLETLSTYVMRVEHRPYRQHKNA